MKDVAIVAFAQAPQVRHSTGTTNGVEMLVPVFQQLYADTGLTNRDIGFWCSGSSDYLSGRAFSFISALDAIGTFPPIAESHVEADGAWALYEAWHDPSLSQDPILAPTEPVACKTSIGC